MERTCDNCKHMKDEIPICTRAGAPRCKYPELALFESEGGHFKEIAIETAELVEERMCCGCVYLKDNKCVSFDTHADFSCYVELKNPFDYQEGGSHYKIDGVMDVAEWSKRRGHCPYQHNVVKYVDRHKKKHGIEDLRKAKHYLEFIAYIEYGENL